MSEGQDNISQGQVGDNPNPQGEGNPNINIPPQDNNNGGSGQLPSQPVDVPGIIVDPNLKSADDKTTGQPNPVDINIQDRMAQAKDKVNPQSNPVQEFIGALEKEYKDKENIKEEYAKEIERIQSLASIEDKNELMLKLIESSVEKLEQEKKRKETFAQEQEQIVKELGYTEINRKIDVLKKDKKLNEVHQILSERSPKLAFDVFKSLTNNFVGIVNKPNVVDAGNTAGTPIARKVAKSAGACIKSGNDIW